MASSTASSPVIEPFIPLSRLVMLTASFSTLSQKASSSLATMVGQAQLNSTIKSLVLIQALSQGAGYDQIDVSACTDHKIQVSNTPTAVDDATADIGMFLIIGALRNLSTSMMALRAGKWRGEPAAALGHDPEGKTLGILGMGGIGRNMANKARAFGMKIRYHNRNRLAQEKEEGAEYVEFDTLLAESDVLSLNLPLNVSSAKASFAKCLKYY